MKICIDIDKAIPIEKIAFICFAVYVGAKATDIYGKVVLDVISVGALVIGIIFLIKGILLFRLVK